MLSDIRVFRGLAPVPLSGNYRTMVGYLTASELPNYFSVLRLPSDLEAFFQVVKNRTNQTRIDRICKNIKVALSEDTKVPHLSLTFAIGGECKVKATRPNVLANLEYSHSDTFIVDGVLTLFSILMLLGHENPFADSRVSKRRLIEDNLLRQKLSSYQIQVTVVFNDQATLSSNDLFELYQSYAIRSTNLQTPTVDYLEDQAPVNIFIRELAKDLRLERFGGMTNMSRSLNKNDPYITTEAIMVRVILGVVGGASVQDKNQIDHNGKLPDGTVINQHFLKKISPLVFTFMDTWLCQIEDQIYRNRDGYHYSSQVWQALGLVMHDLLKKEKKKRDFKIAAKIIGQLDYSKSAEHWSHCNAMKLDATGKYYKNATNGGRTMRVGIAAYFMSLI